MATIGSFTSLDNGFTGKFTTLTMGFKLTITTAPPSNNDKAPDFHVIAKDSIIGAGWKRVSKQGREFVCIKLDDPIFPNAIFANLVPDAEKEGHFNLIWSR